MKRRSFLKTIGTSSLFPFVNFAEQFKTSEFDNFYFDEPHTIEEYRQYFNLFFDGDKLTTFWYKMHNNKHEHTYVFTNAQDLVHYNQQTHNDPIHSINSQLNNLKNHNHDEAKIWFLRKITRIQTYKKYCEWCKVVKVDVKPESEFDKYVTELQMTKVPILIKR